MNRRTFSKIRTWAFASVALAAIAGPAWAEEARQFMIPSQSLVAALEAFGKQGDKEILFSRAQAEGHATAGVTGAYEPGQALAMLLNGSGLKFRKVNENTYVVEASDPQSGSAAGDGADGTVAALIVTAQKREEQIQDVPIAISAFTEKTLEEQKIEGGFDLLKAIPNVTFSKNNFTSYNFSIRGIGTKAVSATTDPAVAVSFNNIALLQNRLFEQEYFDVERVEVLRGPQGTLYGRNATAGVINVISAKPNLQEFDGWVKGEVGNYHAKRLSAMINMPLIQDKLGIRMAGSLTDRAGYDYNEGTHYAVNGRDLWSGRITVGFNPTDHIRSNLVWEHFNEDDNRSRTGKQLCHRDPSPTEINGTPTAVADAGGMFAPLGPLRAALFSQGCAPGSLYDTAAFGTPNGLALPFVYGMLAVGTVWPLNIIMDPNSGAIAWDQPYTLVKLQDPYGGRMQSTDLRVIDSFRDPIYRAKADVVELNADFDISGSLKLFSQTAYNKDSTYSFQDYNRFNTDPVFQDTSNFYLPYAYNHTPSQNLAPGGIYCDPQLGCSNKMAGFDIAQAKGEQFTQELRLQSTFDGPVNFSAGANYTRFRTLVDYYLFYNLITAFAQIMPFNLTEDIPGADASDITTCYLGSLPFQEIAAGTPRGTPGSGCPYIDPNPVENINGQGHNYFRSKNPYRVKSAALFGELYWQVNAALKVTAGLRYTDDKKIFIPVPTQVLLAEGMYGGGQVNSGYPEDPPIKQHWGEWTGRLGVDWKPDFSWSDQSLVYAFYSHGYKAGGANPPSPGFGTATLNQLYGQLFGSTTFSFCPAGVACQFDKPILQLTGVDYGPTFKPEFVDAFEVGSKNTLLGGAMTFNTTAFIYNYKDYQVSQIKNRTAVNENFDARVWGLEFETMFAPTHDFQVMANLGYLSTRIADGQSSIDIMNRTQGNPDFIVAKPWVQIPSNCIVPKAVAASWLSGTAGNGGLAGFREMCGGTNGLLDVIDYFSNTVVIDPATGQPYDPLYYNGQNGTVDIHGGAGIAAQLGGKRLPNAPHWTMNVGTQYGHDILDGSWRAAVRADAYWQSQSWARVYNAVNDKLHGWYNVNLSVWFEKADDDLKIELYAKNILDKTPITDAFINSDDTALTTNVFVLDPRLIGLSIKKGF